MDLEKLLNPTQKAAVEHIEGASVIVAGAGSGKTRVLTYKIAHLIEQGVSPHHILALTFTNKAAREMKSRIMDVVGISVARPIWMGTFHSIFSRILRSEADSIGFTPQFTIYDTSDSKSLLKTIIKELGLDANKSYKASSIQSRISNAKNRLITPTIYSQNSDLIKADVNSKISRFADIYAIYCRRLREANAMDFDDLLVYTAALLNQCPDVLERYQERFKYIMVDEYQDTNTVQHNIVMMLAAKYRNICVVGDDAQSIYSFRGAEIENILSFQQQFTNCQLFKLEQNYRSTQNIVNAANSLIAKNRNQIRKNVFSVRDTGSPIDVLGTMSDNEEAYEVAKDVAFATDSKSVKYEDIAILYRTNAQSRVIEDALRKRNIPYKIYGGLSFYQRKEIKDIIAYLRFLVNPSDEEAFKRIINFPARGIGKTTLDRILSAVHNNPIVPILEILRNVQTYEPAINKGIAAKIMLFVDIIDKFVGYNETYDAYKIVESVVSESGIMADVSVDKSVENLSRKENVLEFIKAVHEFCENKVNQGENEIKLVDFLNEVSLLTDQDNENEENIHTVTLMTIHASKGLEFAYVYIVGVEENLFPGMLVETERELEEERRLFYVAITRAKECCMISYAKSRFRYGEFQFSNPSRFIHDIDKQYLKFVGESSIFKTKSRSFVDPYASSNEDKYQPLFKPKKREVIHTPPVAKTHKGSFKPLSSASRAVGGAVVSGFLEGDVVKHATFGRGMIIRFEGEGDNRKATINFDEFGVKQLLLKYARLTKVD
ncbi:MAG: UvrD-helicase domain-containing protein [bacterium]